MAGLKLKGKVVGMGTIVKAQAKKARKSLSKAEAAAAPQDAGFDGFGDAGGGFEEML